MIKIPENKEIEILNNIIWRSNCDCKRNCVSTYGQYLLGNKQTLNKNSSEMIKMMNKIQLSSLNRNFDFENDIEDVFKYGVFAKRILKQFVNDGETYERSHVHNFTVNLLSSNGDTKSLEELNENKKRSLKLLLSKYFNEDLIDTKDFYCDQSLIINI